MHSIRQALCRHRALFLTFVFVEAFFFIDGTTFIEASQHQKQLIRSEKLATARVLGIAPPPEWIEPPNWLAVTGESLATQTEEMLQSAQEAAETWLTEWTRPAAVGPSGGGSNADAVPALEVWEGEHTRAPSMISADKAVALGLSSTAERLPVRQQKERKARQVDAGALAPSKQLTSSVAPPSAPRSTSRAAAARRLGKAAAEITALAASLGNSPGRIFSYVHDNIDYDPKWGADSPPLGTLWERRGTSWDQAWLLQELLLEAGVDARLEWGEVEISPELLMQIAGTDDPIRAGDLLTTAGLPVVLLISGSQVASARLPHAWVKAHLDYIPNRGATPGPGDTWIRMDPSFKTFERTEGLRLDADVPFALADHLLSGTEQSPRAEYEAALLAYVADNNLGASTLDDLKTRRSLRAENFPFVPGTLRAKILSAVGELESMPDAYQVQLEVKVRQQGGGSLLTWEAPLSSIYGSLFEVSWPGATPADQSTLDLFGGVYATPPYEVDLRPSLSLDGIEMASGTSIGSAEDANLELTATPPAGLAAGDGVPIFARWEMFAGEHGTVSVDFGHAPQQLVDRYVAGALAATESSEVEAWSLAAAAATYLQTLGTDLEHLAALRWHQPYNYGTAVLAVQRGAVSTTSSGTPDSFSLGPLSINVGARTLGLYPVDGILVSRVPTLELIGSQGSVREGEALEAIFGGDHVTAVGFLTLAVREGQTLTRVDAGNVDDALAAAILSRDAEAAVAFAVSQGAIAWIPETQLELYGWRTTGYIIEDPATGGGGYFVTFERRFTPLDGAVIFHSPTDGDVVTAPTDVLATIDVEGIETWTLTSRLLGSETSNVIGTGTGPVANTVVGQFDPTLLLNGMYDLVLRGQDSAGQAVTGRITVAVDGEMKVGHFRLEFLDMETLLEGIPMQVARTYDSRDKEVGDFGYGWRLAVSQVTVKENTLPGRGWQGTVSPGPLPSYCIVPDRPHIVAVSLPDGTLLRFQLVVTPQCQLVAPPRVVQHTLEPLPGTRATLRAIGPRQDLLVVGGFPGPIELWDTDATNILDSELYELSLESGVKLLISDESGLVRIEGERGDTIDYSPTGIEHSDGPSFQIQRDNQGRIEEILGLLGERLLYTYDANGDLETFTDEVGDTYRYIYGANHLLEKIIDPDGNELVAAEYDDDSRLIGVCDGGGDNCWQTTHELVNNKEIINDPEGGVTTLTYDNRGNLETVGNGLGHTWRFEFDDLDQMQRQIDPLGNVTEFTWDAAGNLAAIVEPHEPDEPDADYTTLFSWGAGRRLEKLTTPGGGELIMDFDSAGNMTTMRDGDGNVLSSHTYDSEGRETSESGPYGPISYSDFDQFGNPRQQVSDGITTTSSFDDGGRLTSYSEAGRTASFAYDARGRETSADYGLGHPPLIYDYGITNDWTSAGVEDSTRVERDISLTGRLSRVRVAEGMEATFDYDRAGRIKNVAAPGGQAVAVGYDLGGRMTSLTRENGGATTFVYDAAGRPTEIRDALGHASSLVYRPDGEVKSITDGLGRTWSVDRSPLQVVTTDPLGRTSTSELSPYGIPLRQIHADGTSVTVDYLQSHPMVDADQRPSSILDEGGRLKTFSYNTDLTLDEVSDPTTAVWSYDYDTRRNVAQVTDPIGDTIGFTYDARDRVASSTWGGTFTDTMAYDARGNLSRQSRADGTVVDLGYDDLGRLTSRQSSTGESEGFSWGATGLESSFSGVGATHYTNDADGNVQRIDYPDGSSVAYDRDLLNQVTAVHVQATPTGALLSTRYVYDAVGNIASVEDPLGGITAFEYNGVNKLTRRVLPNGVETLLDYDLRDQVTSVEHRAADNSVIASFAYERRPGGEPFKITLEDGAWIELDYDAAPRLTEERHFDSAGTLLETRGYAYDATGNRLSRTGSSTETYAYSSGHRLASVTAGAAVRELEYDASGRTAISRQGGVERAYAYDFRDRLMSVSDDGVVQASFQYDAEDRRVTSGSAAGDRRLVSAPIGRDQLEAPQLVADTAGNVLGAFVYVGAAPLMRIVDGAPVYYLTDALGSVAALADAGGSAVARFHYDGFGEIRSESGTGATAPAVLGGDYRFHSAWLDSDTGLYYLRARYYAPDLGRFLSRDPVGLVKMSPEASHPYVFANGNPFIYEDPAGLFASVASFNVASAVQSTLNGIRAGFMRRLLRRVLREAKNITLDIIKDLIIRSFVDAIGISQYLNTITDLASKLEHGVQQTMCNILGPNRVPSFVWLEPKIDESGRPFADGFRCPVTPDKQSGAGKGSPWNGKKRLGPRPDFLISYKQPTKMTRPRPFQSLLPGDVKVSVHHAYKTWSGEQRGQKEALRNHANLYAIRNVLLITARGGTKTTCKKVEALFAGDLPPTLLNIWSLVGTFSKRKSGC